MDEIVLAHEGRTALVLMHWTDGSARNYKDVPVKLVFYVTDPVAVAARIWKAGGTMTREPTPIAALGGAVVGLGSTPTATSSNCCRRRTRNRGSKVRRKPWRARGASSPGGASP